VLEQLAAHPRLAGRYEPLLLEGHDGRGIDQALLVERGRVTVLESALANGEDFLFERPPLVVHLLVDGQSPFYLINNHFKSKRGGELETRPRRVAQARYVAALVTQLAGSGAEVVVVGDLNDDEESQTLATIVEGTNLVNLWGMVRPEERYSYSYMGVSQVLDHVLVTPGLGSQMRDFAPLHLNSDYPHSLSRDPATPLRSSDHDPLRVIFRLP
jgi:predicted extracellular nuclease